MLSRAGGAWVPACEVQGAVAPWCHGPAWGASMLLATLGHGNLEMPVASCVQALGLEV
jgi:hypothetical protein